MKTSDTAVLVGSNRGGTLVFFLIINKISFYALVVQTNLI